MDHQGGGLSPVVTGRENIANQLALSGMSRQQILRSIDTVIEFSDLREQIDAVVGTYSLGMRVRLQFAIYSTLAPDLFVVDEALNGGDFNFRLKFQKFLDGFVARGGSILFASHDLFAIQTLSHRCVLLNDGVVHSIGAPDEVIHKFTELSIRQRQDQMIDSVGLRSGEESIVEIDSIQVVGAGGGDLYPGGPAIIRLKCNAKEEVDPCVCGIEIGTAGIFPVASLPFGYSEKCSLKKGSNELVCYIDCLPLLPGTHLLGSAFFRGKNPVPIGSRGYEDSPVTFTIKGKCDEAMNVAFSRNNIMHIPCRWSRV
jgi:lipopolysaccharide transport system ATP-binding protein